MKASFTLTCLLALSGPVVAADRIDQALEEIYQGLNEVHYLGYESVENPQADAYGVHKYMVLDFYSRRSFDEAELQASVHHICTTLLKHSPLVQNLSARGYDMVSVSFDARSQYDCLR